MIKKDSKCCLLQLWLALRWAMRNWIFRCAISEDSDQPAHLCSLIRIFSGHILDGQGCKVSSCGQCRLIWVFVGCTCQEGFLMLPLIFCNLLLDFHVNITKICLFKYTKIYHQKWKFSDKKFWYFSCFCLKHKVLVLIRTALMRQF